MFRLSQIRNLRLQAIISKEMMNAFEDAFKISSGDTEQVASNIEMFCEEMSIPMNSPLERDLLIYKITGMIQEVADSSSAYTFDEQGDWILSKFLLYYMNRYEFFLSLSEDEDASIEDFWESSLTDEDKEFVNSFADDFFDNLIAEIADDEEDAENLQEEYAEQKQLFIDRVTYFPLMAFELTDDVIPEFLFWDRDFLLIEEYGPEKYDEIKNALEKDGNILGLMQVSKNTQFYTGSEKFELNED